MPNYIKNKLEVKGSKESIENLFTRFKKYYPAKPHKSWGGDLTYKKGDAIGWLNEGTNKFNIRGGEILDGVPDGWEQYYNKEFTRFPDFETIVPMPEGMDISSGSWITPLENRFDANKGFKAHIDEIKKYCNGNEGKINEVLENLFQGIRNYIDHGHASWYSWSIENWGTKWNASECSRPAHNVFEFETAWSGVKELIKKMAEEFPGLEITYKWSDEDTGSNCGKVIFYDGKIKETSIENQSKEAFELAFELRPHYKKYYVFNGTTYEYKEEDELV